MMMMMVIRTNYGAAKLKGREKRYLPCLKIRCHSDNAAYTFCVSVYASDKYSRVWQQYIAVTESLEKEGKDVMEATTFTPSSSSPHVLTMVQPDRLALSNPPNCRSTGCSATGTFTFASNLLLEDWDVIFQPRTTK